MVVLQKKKKTSYENSVFSQCNYEVLVYIFQILELQIRGSIEDTPKIIFFISQ